ncbi:unnamed protein product [Absidia cylindrospora]
MIKIPETFGLIEVTATTIVALMTGVFIGRQLSKHVMNDFNEADDEDNLNELPEGTYDATKYDDYKMVLVVRTNLGMTKGKIAAQCGHATLACYKAVQKTNPKALQKWERSGQAKVALKAVSEEQLLELQAVALSLNITAQSICDAGRTQIAAGSRTVLGVGPGPVDLLNQVTGHLKLL